MVFMDKLVDGIVANPYHRDVTSMTYNVCDVIDQAALKAYPKSKAKFDKKFMTIYIADDIRIRNSMLRSHSMYIQRIKRANVYFVFQVWAVAMHKCYFDLDHCFWSPRQYRESGSIPKCVKCLK